jgi:polyisoprenyl-phosphate glycosyltransferase
VISLVIPIYNESECLPVLYQRLVAAASTWNEDWECILVDDGSRDGSLDSMRDMAAKDGRFKVLSFSRNFGHQSAVTAGLCYASGDLVAVMDADLQDPPEELRAFFQKCREGYDVVYAIRTDRKEGFLKRLSYWLYYRFLKSFASVDIPLDSGDFCVMSRLVVDTMNALPERNRFVRGLRTWVGYRQTGLAYRRSARQSGEPKYTSSKLMNLALDGLVNFSFKPLRVLAITGVLIGVFSFFAAFLVFLMYVTDTTIAGYNPHNSQGWTSLILAIFFLSGAQLVGMGILGEYIGRLFEETKARPMYLIREQINFGHQERLHPGRRRSPGETSATLAGSWD